MQNWRAGLKFLNKDLIFCSHKKMHMKGVEIARIQNVGMIVTATHGMGKKRNILIKLNALAYVIQQWNKKVISDL